MQYHLLKKIYFPLWVFWVPFLTIYAWFYFWAFNSVSLVYMSVFMQVPHYFDYYNFVIYFEIKKYDASIFHIHSQDCFGSSVLLWFHRNFRIVLYTFVKNALGILIGIALNLYMALVSMGILTILILPIHEHKIPVNLLIFISLFC